jgi:hypothetical protein
MHLREGLFHASAIGRLPAVAGVPVALSRKHREETRVDGEAVNPEKFLEAGAKLFGDGQIVRSSRSEFQD